MNVQRPIGAEQPDEDSEIECDDARARASLDAGRGIAHEEVRRWVTALGTPEAFPMPGEWRE